MESEANERAWQSIFGALLCSRLLVTGALFSDEIGSDLTDRNPLFGNRIAEEFRFFWAVVWQFARCRLNLCVFYDVEKSRTFGR